MTKAAHDWMWSCDQDLFCIFWRCGSCRLDPLVFKQCSLIRLIINICLCRTFPWCSKLSHFCNALYHFTLTYDAWVDLQFLLSSQIPGKYLMPVKTEVWRFSSWYILEWMICFLGQVLQQVRAGKKDDNGACWGSGSCDHCCDGHSASLLHTQDWRRPFSSLLQVCL